MEASMNNFIYVMGSIVMAMACYGCGWYAGRANLTRQQEADEIIASLKPTNEPEGYGNIGDIPELAELEKHFKDVELNG